MYFACSYFHVILHSKARSSDLLCQSASWLSHFSQALSPSISLHYILHGSQVISVSLTAPCYYMLISIGFICFNTHIMQLQNLYDFLQMEPSLYSLQHICCLSLPYSPIELSPTSVYIQSLLSYLSPYCLILTLTVLFQLASFHYGLLPQAAITSSLVGYRLSKLLSCQNWLLLMIFLSGSCGSDTSALIEDLIFYYRFICQNLAFSLLFIPEHDFNTDLYDCNLKESSNLFLRILRLLTFSLSYVIIIDGSTYLWVHL